MQETEFRRRKHCFPHCCADRKRNSYYTSILLFFQTFNGQYRYINGSQSTVSLNWGEGVKDTPVETSTAITTQSRQTSMCVAFSEAMFKGALEGTDADINIIGNIIKNQTDDTVVIASSLKGLHLLNDPSRTQRTLLSSDEDYQDETNRVFKNPSRNHFENIRKDSQTNVISEILWNAHQQTQRQEKEIRQIIEQGNLHQPIASSALTSVLGCSAVTYFLFSFSGCESWTLDSATDNRVDMFEMYLYRRTLRIFWAERRTNKEAVNRINNSKELLI